MILPKLYKYSKKGALQEWSIEVEGAKYRTHAGQTGGAITTTEWTYVEGKNVGKKNEKSAEEQAAFDAQAKWTKKKDREQYRETPEAAQSSEGKFAEPMRAEKYKDYRDEIDFSKGVYVQNKFNGVRCAAKGKLLSRKGKEFVSCPHIVEALKQFHLDNPEISLDGELYNYGLRQNLGELLKIVRKSVKITPELLQRSKEIVEFHVYDVFSESGVVTNLDYDGRLHVLSQIFSKYFGKDSPIKLAETIPVHSHEEIDELMEKAENDGEEGVIVRLGGHPYEFARVSHVLKYKNFIDAEFTIVGAIEGRGNLAGMIGAFQMKDDEGREFEATPIGSHDLWREYWRTLPSLIGQKGTIRYKELTPITERGGGVPFHAKFVAVRNYE